MCQHCEWESLLARLSEMVEDDDYDWAIDTLEGIQNTVTVNECCTDRQREAVENIEDAVARRRDW